MTIKPLFATEKHTADLLDMPKSTFRDLVADGVLPGPVVIGGESVVGAICKNCIMLWPNRRSEGEGWVSL